MRQISWIFLCFSLLLVACQRMNPPENRVGLDNDSHSYSYVSFPESRMIQAAKTIDAVSRAKVEYNGVNIIMDIYVKPGVHPRNYALIEAQVRKKVTQSAPLNPFILQVHPTKESRT
jgi:hypothetical protein